MDLETRMKAWDRKFYALTSFPQVRASHRELCMTLIVHSVKHCCFLAQQHK
jgi:hypothetical protein